DLAAHRSIPHRGAMANGQSRMMPPFATSPFHPSRLRRRLLERRHGLGELVEPRHQAWMAGAPFAFVAEVEIAERAGKRQVAVIGAGGPHRRAALQEIERAVDLELLALLPGG